MLYQPSSKTLVVKLGLPSSQKLRAPPGRPPSKRANGQIMARRYAYVSAADYI